MAIMTKADGDHYPGWSYAQMVAAHQQKYKDRLLSGTAARGTTLHETGDKCIAFASWENNGWFGRSDCRICQAAIIGMDMDFVRLNHATIGPIDVCGKCVATIGGMVQHKPDRSHTATVEQPET